MKDDLIARLRAMVDMCGFVGCSECMTCNQAADEIERLRADVAEARRRRDEWRKKAEGFDTIRRALREKIGDPPPLQMSRFLWAAIAVDEKKRADDAEAESERLRARVAELEATVNEWAGV